MPSAALCLKRQQHSIRLGRRRRKGRERGDDDAEQHNFLSSAATAAAAAAATHTDMCRRDGKRPSSGWRVDGGGETVNIDGT